MKLTALKRLVTAELVVRVVLLELVEPAVTVAMALLEAAQVLVAQEEMEQLVGTVEPV